jgi:hypothetical protein
MLLTVQFPLADLRPFVPAPTKRLLKPPWPRARADEDFVRLFGPVRKRVRGGVDEWPGEGIYCDAGRAIRFSSAFTVGAMLGVTSRYGAFRRFFSDGEGASRVEIGIRVRRKDQWALKKLLELLHDTLSLSVTVGRNDEATKTELIKAGKPLARLMLRASTSAKAGREFQPEMWWVRPCTPALLIEYDNGRERLTLPPGFTAMRSETTFGVDLSYGLMRFFGRSIGVWFLGSNPFATFAGDYRRFRIHLLRLHAQREVVTEVLRQIQTQTLTVERTSPQDDQQHPSNRLQRFVVNNIEQMERQTYNGVPQSALLRAAEQIQDSVTPGERATILEGLRPLRRFVSYAVQRFTDVKTSAETIVIVEEGGNYQVTQNTQNFSGAFHGDVAANQVVADTIQNSFNRVEKAQVSDNLKARLQDLNKLIQELVKKLPPDEQEKAARNLDVLTTQATAKKPDRRWYEVSAEGLAEAAKAVADFAKPVATAVGAVLALLA